MVHYLLPVLFVAILPTFQGGFEILRVLLLSTFPLFYLIVKPISLNRIKKLVFPLVGLIIVYVLSFFYNNQNYINFLMGHYRRNFGILTLLGVFILFVIFTSTKINQRDIIIKYFYLTLVLGIFYGLFQVNNIDPIVTDSGEPGLTLGNTNFASAFLGILSIVPLMYFLMEKKNIKWLHLVVFFLNVYVILQIGSVQGLVFVLINIVLISFHQFSKSQKINRINTISAGIIFSVFTIGLLSASFASLQGKNFLRYIDQAVQLSSRLDHWALALRIAADHFWLGVGVDDMFRFSGEYITESTSNLYGGFILPDRSHNTILDHLVGGGIFAMIFWIVFCIQIFIIIFYLLNRQIYKKEIKSTIIFSSIWVNYFVQTLISPDQLVIFTLGMISAGSVVAIYLEQSSFKQLRNN